MATISERTHCDLPARRDVLPADSGDPHSPDRLTQQHHVGDEAGGDPAPFPVEAQELGRRGRHPQRLGEWLVEVVERVFDGLIHGEDRARHRRVLKRQLAIALGHRAAIERKSRSE